MAIKELKGINKRPRYFAGQYLLEDDFELEQDYSRDRLQRYTRSLHVSGIAGGLIASKPNDSTLKLAVDISAGTAIDPKGRQVVLLESRQVDLSKDLVEPVQLDNGFYILFISYDEQESDPQDGNTSTNRRILENPIFKLIKFSTSPPSDDSIAIAKLTIQDGNVSIPGDSNSVRKYTGLRLPTLENTNAPTWRSKGGNLAVFSGSLEIAGSQTVGSTTFESHLYLSGGTGPFAQFYRDAIDGKDYLGIEAFKQNDSQTKSAIVLQEFGGNVGIGAANPSRKLEILGDVAGLSFEVGAGSPHSGAIRFGDNTGWKLHFGRSRESATGTKNAGTQGLLMTIQDNGNVGIGTADPGTSKLKVANSANDFADISFAESGAGQLQIIGWSSGWNINTKTTGKHLYLNRDSDTTSNIYIGRKDKEVFVRGSDGRVGIGTTSPTAKLDISGAANTVGQISLQLRSGNTSDNYNSNQLTLGYSNTDQYRHAIKTRHNAGARRGNAIDFYVWKYLAADNKDNPEDIGTLHTMTLDGGNVGIGTTSPSSKLTIQTPSGYGGNTIRFEAQAESSLYYLNLNTNVTDGVVSWVFDQNNSGNNYQNVLAFDRGKIGIGTATPLQTLDVNGRIHVNNGVIQRGGTAITDTKDLGLYSQVAGNYIRIVTNNAPIKFYTDSGIGTKEKMSINTDGSINVTGSIKSSGTSLIKDIRAGIYNDGQGAGDIGGGWVRLAGDLNQGAGGKFIYLEILRT